MTNDKLRRLRGRLVAEARIDEESRGYDSGKASPLWTLGEIDRLLAEPEKPATDAEIESAMHRIVVTAIAYDRSAPDSPREEATMYAKAGAFDALRTIIARRAQQALASGIDPCPKCGVEREEIAK